MLLSWILMSESIHSSFKRRLVGSLGHKSCWLSKPGILGSPFSAEPKVAGIWGFWYGAPTPCPSQRNARMMSSLLIVCFAAPGVGILPRPCLCLFYPSQCGPSILCYGEIVHLVFWPFSEWNDSYVAVDLLCLCLDVSSGSSYPAILGYPKHQDILKAD